MHYFSRGPKSPESNYMQFKQGNTSEVNGKQPVEIATENLEMNINAAALIQLSPPNDTFTFLLHAEIVQN